MKLGSKILITGVYGSGKTTLATKLLGELNDPTDKRVPIYTKVSFDDNIAYGPNTWTVGGLSHVHEVIRNSEFTIIDALPKLPLALGEDERWDDLIKNYDCTVILVKCPLDIWLKRCEEKRHTDGVKQDYLDFYESIDKVLEGVDYITYNSDTSEFGDKSKMNKNE